MKNITKIFLKEIRWVISFEITFWAEINEDERLPEK